MNILKDPDNIIYLTEFGRYPVTIYEVYDNEAFEYPVHGCINHDNGTKILAEFTLTGRCKDNKKFNLMAVGKYAHIEINDCVLVKDYVIADWVHRHFAGVTIEGLPQTFSNGTSAFTAESDDSLEVWQYCELEKTSGIIIKKHL